MDSPQRKLGNEKVSSLWVYTRKEVILMEAKDTVLGLIFLVLLVASVYLALMFAWKSGKYANNVKMNDEQIKATKEEVSQ